MRYLLSLIFAFNVLFSASFVYPNFKQCYNKEIKSIVYFGDTKAIAISGHYAVTYSKTKPKYHFVKHDPFLNLYLFYSKKLLHPIKLKNTDKLSLGEWLASISENSLYTGNFAQRGGGLDIYFKQNSKTPPNSLISCLCCQVYGIGIGDGKFISSNLLKRFLNSKKVFYGDIGARFSKLGAKVIVSSINPLFKNQKLKVGDIIKKINSKKITREEEAKNLILFQKKNQIVNIKFLRKNTLHSVKIKVQKRFGGGELSDSFLESRGLYLDKKLKIIKIVKNSFGAKSGLHIGDKLMQVDRISVENSSDIRKIFSKTDKKEINLLFDRNNFQFFIKVNM
ncbi:MAG: PDZ domain-containing protein [Epsilonproteobacteria bacterium]|nr:PDZ domain-containing protein [Campylobacterota bacterium]